MPPSISPYGQQSDLMQVVPVPLLRLYEPSYYLEITGTTNSESLAAGRPFPAAAHCRCHRYLLVAKRVHRWLEPMLYEVVDLYHQKTAGLFISSLRFRPDFAKTAVKVLHLHPAIRPAQGAEILQLCQGLQELSLQIVVNLPRDQNPLYEPLGALQLKTLSMDLASSFYGPTIFLPDLHLLCHIERLHLTNTWVARRGLFIGLQELRQLSHLSFHVLPPGQESIHTEIILEVLRRFSRLRVVILWRMEYQESQEIYNHLGKHDLADHRIIVFNAMHFVECATPVNSFWGLAESVVRWREANHVGPFDVPSDTTFPGLPL
ncbi:hypothetical protein BKA82DRAFT_4016184 [Pisolithus tinctorius]|nr:hypothetical protein BKA82DRAFT_4016184 [Pisolithus tinctorius]